MQFALYFQQAQANLKWFIEHHGQLQDQYPNRLVAVYKGKVVATARLKDFLALLRRLDRKGIPRSAVLFEFIYAKGEEPNLIFAAA